MKDDRHNNITLRKICQNVVFLWSVYFRVRTESLILLRLHRNIQARENACSDIFYAVSMYKTKIMKISRKHSTEKSIDPLQLDKPPHLKKQVTIIRDLMIRYQNPSLHKKWNFPLWIYSVNVTKFAVSCFLCSAYDLLRKPR